MDVPTPSYRLDQLLPVHIDAITSIHMAAFPERALSFLGCGAIARYYRTLLSNPKFNLGVGVFEKGRLIGYLIGGETNLVMRTYLKKHLLFLSFTILTHPWLILKPIIRKKLNMASGLLKIAVMLRIRKLPAPNRPKTFSVMVIAVDPRVQNKGVGTLLMQHAESVAAQNEFVLMHLSVDPANDCAVRFYKKLGWEQDRVENWSGRMNKKLRTSKAGSYSRLSVGEPVN